MAKHNKTLLVLSSKLGLVEDKVISKAAEFERLLQTKSTAGTNMTDTSKLVICLDLAATILGAEFDGKMAIKYSGLKGPSYASSKKIVQNLLELNNEKLTTSLLCVMLQCGTAQELADNILWKYRKSSKIEMDMNLPQYVCMAVYQACRMSKIKVPKSKFIEKSRLKTSQWNVLDAAWTKFVDSNFTAVEKKRGVAKTIVNDAESIEHMEVDTEDKEEPSEPEIEPYEVWRDRMLEMAYRGLKEQKEAENKKKLAKFATSTESSRNNTEKQAPVKNSSRKKLQNHLEVSATDSSTSDIEKDEPIRRSPRKMSQKSLEQLAMESSRSNIEKVAIFRQSPRKRSQTCLDMRRVEFSKNDAPFRHSPRKMYHSYMEMPMAESSTNNTDRATPRKSPRKTPQKYSPYKTQDSSVRFLCL